jgi:hypothetical protein
VGNVESFRPIWFILSGVFCFSSCILFFSLPCAVARGGTVVSQFSLDCCFGGQAALRALQSQKGKTAKCQTTRGESGKRGQEQPQDRKSGEGQTRCVVKGPEGLFVRVLDKVCAIRGCQVRDPGSGSCTRKSLGLFEHDGRRPSVRFERQTVLSVTTQERSRVAECNADAVPTRNTKWVSGTRDDVCSGEVCRVVAGTRGQACA